MAKGRKVLLDECWELIFNRLHHQSDLESFSLVCKSFLALTNRLRLHLPVIGSTLLIHGTISKLVHRFPNHNSIDLSNFKGELDPVLVDLASSISYTSNLEQLDISDHKRLPIKGLKELGRKLKGLRVLKCSYLTLLRDTDLYVIAELFPFLEELDISYPGTNHTCGSRYIPADASYLTMTDSGIEVLSGNHLITDRSLLALSMNCLNLEGIEVEDCALITLKGILLMLRTCAALSYISMSGMAILGSSSDFECLATSSRSLQTLEVSHSFITDEFLFLVAKASLLYFLTDESMNGLSQYLQCLDTIGLSDCVKLTISTFFTLARNCPSLEEVYMENTSIGMKKGCFPNVVKNPRICAVNLADNLSLDDDALTKVASMCPTMEILDVSSCTSLTGAGIASALEMCNQIRKLQFDDCPLTTHIGKGAELPNLEAISAAGSALNDEGLAMIGSRCSRLVKLNLENCKEVTAEGIQAMMKNCRSLRKINLKKCPQVSINFLSSLVVSSASLTRVIPPCCSAFSD
ncbi:F-box/LRR-repeat protein 3-like [Lycium ferocissimum]|uniref:F-box/LRR-repeat protein 3-like n=1 Tax=Lycium ferocissimum TaxID=112874 RepID=UPI0028149ED0|nr:F-box/LRR-repeat protein 3-like [Lycium ferocissimum]